MNQERARRGAWLALAALSLIWSYNWIVMKQALAYAGPFTFSALRYVGGTTVLFGPLLGTRPDARQQRATALAAAGLLLVIAPWQGFGSTPSVLLALAGGLSWAAGTVLAKRLFVRHADVGLLRVSAWQMLYGTLLLVLLAIVIPQPPVQWTPPFLAAMAYNVLLASGLGWAMWLLLVQRLPTHVASLTSLAIPLMGVLLAWLILHEQPGPFEWAGIALIAAALLSLRRASSAG